MKWELNLAKELSNWEKWINRFHIQNLRESLSKYVGRLGHFNWIIHSLAWADQNKNMASTIIWLPPISSLLSLFQLIDSPGWHRFSNDNQSVVPHKKTQLSGWAKCAQFFLGGDIECTLLYFTVISTVSMNRAAAMVYGTGRHWPVSTTTGAYFVKACFTYTALSSLKKKC